MSIKPLALAAMLGLLSACDSGGDATQKLSNDSQNTTQNANADGWITTASGLMYKILKPGNGDKPKNGQIVTVHYKGVLQNGTQFDSSYDRGEPINFPLGENRVIKAWDEGIALLSVGAHAYIYCPSNLAYGSIERPNIPANSDLTFEVQLLNISEPLKPYDVSGVTPQKTASGIEIYVIKSNEDGNFPMAGQRVSMHYTGYLKDGTKFDSSTNHGKPFPFNAGRGEVIPGWDEAVLMLREGEKARWIIPYQLAYGETGYGGVIPPKADLIFDVELVAINAQ